MHQGAVQKNGAENKLKNIINFFMGLRFLAAAPGFQKTVSLDLGVARHALLFGLLPVFTGYKAIHPTAENKETYGFPLFRFLSYSTLRVGRGACSPGISTG
ncbi:hypothetical protein ACOXXE_13500 [Pseudomonas mediterranea]|uniref:hypothetical protein n=1 Tax=Pseudomonas mediterranea TaxID=183795 RepID=UPI003BF5CC13